jgi:hypothetical protein
LQDPPQQKKAGYDSVQLSSQSCLETWNRKIMVQKFLLQNNLKQDPISKITRAIKGQRSGSCLMSKALSSNPSTVE